MLDLQIKSNGQAYVTINGKDYAIPEVCVKIQNEIKLLQRLKKFAPMTFNMIMQELDLK